jgi:predicted acyltransferase
MKEQDSQNRLESLDALRGFDLFCLVGLEAVVHRFSHAIDAPCFNDFMWNFHHQEWIGFSTWDLVMPLFMFMAGVSLPFSLSRYKDAQDKTVIYKRIFKRVVLLWIFGMICQGNLLALDPNRIYLYSNTLQSIAAGYLIAAILFLHTNIRTQIGIASGLLLLYWFGMEIITVEGYGGGNYTPGNNFAEWVDRTILGRFRDCAQVVDGNVIFADNYRYTWIYSSGNFGVTVLSGVFSGYILRNKMLSGIRKTGLLLGIGIAALIVGWCWGFYLPVIKKIWTSSMVLVSSGYCFILMGTFYYWIDYKRHRKFTKWLKIYGMNSILAYMLTMTISFSSIGSSLFFGLEQYVGAYYPVLIAIANAGIIYGILWIMYQKKIFLKV